MSFKEALTVQIAAASKGPRCTVCALQDTLDPADWNDLCASMAESSIPHTVIYRALKSMDVHVGDGAIARHRKGECKHR